MLDLLCTALVRHRGSAVPLRRWQGPYRLDCGFAFEPVGVPAETIIADYGLTAHYLVEPYPTLPDADAAIRTWEDYQAIFFRK